MRKLLLFVLSILFFTSCSQFNNGPISTGWHNLNAKYNSLLIARTDFKYADDQISKYGKENYSTILPIFSKIDSNKLDSAKFLLNDAIKKTSQIAERHSNSKFLFDAYLILGKARLSKGEFYNAIETFKYVNTKSKSTEKRNEALIWLFRAYIENEDYITANQVANLISNGELNENSKGLFLTTKAYFHQKQNEDELALVFLEESLKYYKVKSKKIARYCFIVGQYYDKFNNNVMARKYYTMTLKNKPYYDLEFNANMGLKMNESLAHESMAQFDDMINDRKNQDLLDKIYFKMGELESQKKHYQKAIGLYSLAANKAQNDPVQKAYAFKAIGDIYFEKLNDFENGAVYYDSTLISIPKTMDEYKVLSQKALVYNDFIKYNRTYRLEDSLQNLAALSSDDLNKKLNELATSKIENEQKVKAVSLKSEVSDKKWLFYDQTEYIKTKNEFIRIWGNRELDDNWRRNNKSISSTASTKPDAKEGTNVKEISREESKQKAIDTEKSNLLAKIPSTPALLEASKKRQEEALFNLGKIYKIQFNDNSKSTQTFESFLQKFPASQFIPEVLYFLVLESGENATKHKEELISKYPNTSFARQIQKGTTIISKDSELQASKMYAEAFEAYDASKYDLALTNLNNGLIQFVGSKVEDKMAYLRILTLSKINSKEQYTAALNDFMLNYPSSNLLVQAKLMLENLKNK